jgi:hypothetical protein
MSEESQLPHFRGGRKIWNVHVSSLDDSAESSATRYIGLMSLGLAV